MALIKGKQIQGTSVSLDKLDGTGSVTLTGSITAPAASILITSAPGADNHAVNKAYVDSVATGLDVKQSVVAVYRASTAAAGGTPAIPVQNELNGVPADDQSMYTAIIGGPGTINSLVLDGITITNGDRVLINVVETGRQKVNGIYIYQANELVRAYDADNQAQVGEVSGGMFTFVEQGQVYGDTGWVLSFPNGSIPATGTSGLWDYTNNPTGNVQIQFTQFSAAGVAEAGIGLSRVGTKFNLNYDNTVFQINGSDELAVRNGGITNAMLTNSTHTFAGDSGTGTVALGSTLTIAGGTNGIDTVYSSGTLTINLDLSELATVTTIADADFIAISSSGAVNQKITFANLKTLIGAASQLNLSVEGGSAASFDLDTDTLDFSAGDGLTFTKSSSTAGTPDTLTVTLNLNAITEDVFTSFTVAANGTFTKTLSFATTQIIHVMINGVTLKSSQYSVSGTTLTIPANAIPYQIEVSDELSVRYIKQA